MEADFQRFYRIDYRDFYRPGGGESRLTLRRMLLLVEQLPPESAFQSERHDRVPISVESAATYSVYQAVTGKPHPAWTQREREREEAARKIVMAAARERARKFNAGRTRSLTK